jgi:hypothetical protein
MPRSSNARQTVDELVDRLIRLQRHAEGALDVVIGPPDIGAVSLQHLELVADGLSAIGDVEKAAGIAVSATSRNVRRSPAPPINTGGRTRGRGLAMGFSSR